MQLKFFVYVVLLLGSILAFLGKASAQKNDDANICKVLDIKTIALTTNDEQVRVRLTEEWLAKYGKSCEIGQLGVVKNNLPAWLGTANTNKISQTVDSLYLSKTMLVTIVKGNSKSCWCRDGWIVRRAKRKLKDGKVMCHVGRKVLNRTFKYAADAIKHCETNRTQSTISHFPRVNQIKHIRNAVQQSTKYPIFTSPVVLAYSPFVSQEQFIGFLLKDIATMDLLKKANGLLSTHLVSLHIKRD